MNIVRKQRKKHDLSLYPILEKETLKEFRGFGIHHLMIVANMEFFTWITCTVYSAVFPFERHEPVDKKVISKDSNLTFGQRLSALAIKIFLFQGEMKI